jgi:hypothetical protein
VASVSSVMDALLAANRNGEREIFRAYGTTCGTEPNEPAESLFETKRSGDSD